MEELPVIFWDAPYVKKPSESHAIQPLSLAAAKGSSVSGIWQLLQGSDGWAGLLNPLNPLLRDELLKFGGFAQATYDAFDFEPFSLYCGSCLFSERRLLYKVGLRDSGYDVTRYLYAAITEVPVLLKWLVGWLQRSLLRGSWTEQTSSNWIGFVSVSNDQETLRLGRRNILVAWRGTQAPSEWVKDIQVWPERLGKGGAMVEHGFNSVYTAKNASSKYSSLSASQQVMAEIKRLVDEYHGKRKEVVSLTITGHSLGGALALLNAYEAAAASIPGLALVSVFTFGAPRVGNSPFVKEAAKVGVKLLRVVVEKDIVPGVPIIGYTHGGVEMELRPPKLDKPLLDVIGRLADYHNLKTYLNLVAALGTRISHVMRLSKSNGPSIPLVSMPSETLADVLLVRDAWYRLVDKGLVQGPPGWSWPEREAEDVPSPPADEDAEDGRQVDEPCSGEPVDVLSG